jgi:hypothetical protein
MRWGAAAAAAMMMALVSCAAGPPASTTLPAPPEPAARPGQWETTYALYDPELFGPERPLAELIASYRLRLTDGKLKNSRLLLNKAQRRLELWVSRGMIKAYRVQLGQNPNGPKVRQGDLRTPEGRYFICAQRSSTFYLALWISYPNLNDARAGLRAGRISQKEFEEIAAALKKGACPPQETNLGGLLLLHGQLPEYSDKLAREQHRQPDALRPGLQFGDADPSKVREFQDWTDGCAALFNPDIRELYEFIPDGAPLTIVANGPVTRPAAKKIATSGTIPQPAQ